MTTLDVDAFGYLHVSIDATIDNIPGLCKFASRFVGNSREDLYGFFVGYIAGDFEREFENQEERRLTRGEYEDLIKIISEQKTRLSDAIQDIFEGDSVDDNAVDP